MFKENRYGVDVLGWFADGAAVGARLVPGDVFQHDRFFFNGNLSDHPFTIQKAVGKKFSFDKSI